jgi:hypothetical protein
MDVYAQIVEKIIRAQESIIGPVAIEQAMRVPHLQIDWGEHKVNVEGDEPRVVDNLISTYKELFGQSSVEVCKEAAAPFVGQLTADKLPEALK